MLAILPYIVMLFFSKANTKCCTFNLPKSHAFKVHLHVYSFMNASLALKKSPTLLFTREQSHFPLVGQFFCIMINMSRFFTPT